jgi:hypothetical protein
MIDSRLLIVGKLEVYRLPGHAVVASLSNEEKAKVYYPPLPGRGQAKRAAIQVVAQFETLIRHIQW